MNLDKLDEFVTAYLECALWSSLDENDEPMDMYETSARLAAAAREDCAQFIEGNAADLEGLDVGQCGYDFWLSRNGHGAGFFDRGNGSRFCRLQDAARVWGSVDLFINSQGEVDF